MDLKGLDKIVAQADEPVTVTIYKPNGDPYTASDGSESTVTVVGSESKKYKAAQRRITDRVLHKRRSKMKAEEVEENSILLVASAVIDWHGWEDGDQPAPCTPDNVKALLRVGHIREQVDEAIRGHADFFTENLAA